MKKIITQNLILILLILGCMVTPDEISASAFEAGVPFLMIYPGAKATAMGGAFSAIADDATASYYNPAALANFENIEFTLIHTPWLRGLAPDMYYEFTGFVYPLKVGTIGGHVIFSYYGEVEAYESPDQSLGSWSPYDLAITFSYGYKLRDNLNLGADVKFIHSFLAPEDILRKATGIEGGGSGTTFGIGAGLLYYSPVKGLRISAVLDNLGPGISYTSTGEKDPLPLVLRLGAGYTPLYTEHHRLTFAVDIDKVLVGIMDDYKEEGLNYVLREAWKHIGVDYTFFDMISLRLGYFMDKEGDREGFTFGGGISFKGFKIDISDDHNIYSFDQGANIRYGISYVLTHKKK